MTNTFACVRMCVEVRVRVRVVLYVYVFAFVFYVRVVFVKFKMQKYLSSEFVMQNIKIFIIHWKYCRGPVDFQKESVLLLESILSLLGNTQYEYAVAFKNLKFFQAQSALIRCTFKEAVNFFDKEYFDFKAIFEKRSFTCWSRLRIE